MGRDCRFGSIPFVVLVKGPDRRADMQKEHIVAQYLILIYEDEEAWARVSPDDAGQIHAAHQTFGEDNGAVLRGGNALQPTSTATSLRSDAQGGFSVTDGPFAETKEALGGYYVIEAEDLDQALTVAKKVPARFGGVEVRPIREMT